MNERPSNNQNRGRVRRCEPVMSTHSEQPRRQGEIPAEPCERDRTRLGKNRPQPFVRTDAFVDYIG